MLGLIHQAAVYRRVTMGGSTQWSAKPLFTWRCRKDPLSTRLQLRDDLALSTHRAIGEDPPQEIQRSDKLVFADGEYLAAGVQRYSIPGNLNFSVEVFLTRMEA